MCNLIRTLLLTFERIKLIFIIKHIRFTEKYQTYTEKKEFMFSWELKTTKIRIRVNMLESRWILLVNA